MGPVSRASPFKLRGLHMLSDELVRADASALNAAQTSRSSGPCLSFMDHTTVTIGSFGYQLLYRKSIVAPLFRQALSETLAVLPWFAGRLVLNPDGRSYDIACTNSGVRFLVDSSLANLGQLEEALTPGKAQSSGGGGALWNPIEKYGTPRDPSVLVNRKLPLSTVHLLQLSGGGSLLAVSAWHGMTDFEGLQTFVAHFSAAYNTALARRSGGNAGSNGGATMSAPTSPPPDRLAPGYLPAALEAVADSKPPPLGAQLPELTVAVPWWRWGFFLACMVWRMFVHGGGLEVRTFHLSSKRLAELKQTAMRELAASKTAGEGGSARGGDGPRASSAGSKRDSSGGDGGGDGDGGSDGESEQQASGKVAAAAVPWVSTRDCLAARLAQVLQALPLRRQRPLPFFVAANMRPRLQPPLPVSRLGNCSWVARVSGVSASEMGLGELAARVRTAISCDLPGQFWRETRLVRELMLSHDARRLTGSMALDPDPHQNLLTAHGPFMLSDWRVKYDLWQFGPEPPIAWSPIIFGVPNVFLIYPAPPAACDGGGLCVYASMHRVGWRQLEQTAGGNLAHII